MRRRARKKSATSKATSKGSPTPRPAARAVFNVASLAVRGGAAGVVVLAAAAGAAADDDDWGLGSGVAEAALEVAAVLLLFVCRKRSMGAMVKPVRKPVPPMTAATSFSGNSSTSPSAQQLVLLPPVEQHHLLSLQRYSVWKPWSEPSVRGHCWKQLWSVPVRSVQVPVLMEVSHWEKQRPLVRHVAPCWQQRENCALALQTMWLGSTVWSG